jgi:allantoate deiminase
MLSEAELAAQVLQRIDALAQISEEPGRLTRTFGSPAMRRANELVASWMREAGMATREDAVGNLIGRYPGARSDAKTLLLGSHLDTVRDAGKFDGPLGVLAAIAAVHQLHHQRASLPFATEVIGFADEEGVRFQSTYLGSRTLAGTLSDTDLARTDSVGITLAEAIRRFVENPTTLASSRRDPAALLGYVEVHIEQGPVLERLSQAVGVVTVIAGQTRAKAIFTGRAAHAGTTPMELRQDALCGAAAFITAVERAARAESGLVATVGQVDVQPGASNVIPGQAQLTVDIRHAQDNQREAGVENLAAQAGRIADERRLSVRWEVVQSVPAVQCDPELSGLLADAVQRHQSQAPRLASGAGHDAVALASITPVAMLFVRCKDGVSHHPAESVQADDVRVAVAVLNDFLQALARKHHG